VADLDGRSFYVQNGQVTKLREVTRLVHEQVSCLEGKYQTEDEEE
jgi:cell division protein ZapA (FtsZ GTPase activity inhibitor)